MRIERNNNGRYCLLDSDGEPKGNKYTGLDFEKIEKINDHSNYYCLWKNDVCFYLLHTNNDTSRFVGGCYPYGFKEIRHYSDVTQSFVAYRSDFERAHLLYEDFYQVSDVFIEVGEECDNEFRSRPVKYTDKGQLWCFFQTKLRKFAWNKGSGYEMPAEGLSLHQYFPNSYYSVQNEDGYFTLAFYNKDEKKYERRFHYFKWSDNRNYKFKSIESVGKYLICESVGKFYYVFNTKTYKRVPLCSSISKPIIGKGYIILSSGDHYQIFKNDRIIENDWWRENCRLIVEDNYVFCQNGEKQSWKIYWLKNGKEVYTGWQNIHIENKSDGIQLIVDTGDILHLERMIQDILSEHQRWLDMLCLARPQTNNNILQIPSVEKENDFSNITDSSQREDFSQQDNNTEKSYGIKIKDQQLPDHIDFIVALNSVRTIKNEGKYIDCSRKCDKLKSGDVILWYDKSKCCLYVTIYRMFRIYKVLFIKESVLDKDFPIKFTPVSIINVNEQNLIDKLYAVLNDKETEIVNVNKQKIKIFLAGMGFNALQVNNALDALYPESTEKKSDNDKSCQFSFKDKSYSLKPNDIWDVDNPFFRQKYLPKKDFIAVLIGRNHFGNSSLESIDYELVGQGSDKRFDQDFNTPVNKAIRDNTKRILLFKKSDNCLVFFDEVECINYAILPEDVYEVNSRKIIKFYLRSLIKCSSK